ncbi:hypothetical protein KBG31_01175 [Patescibacteria group bacterium]|nr:hypothetical protein [Patescibacteria group bacterium]
MPKSLAGKIQKITPKLNPTESAFSYAINISPDEEDSINKRGHLYAVFELIDTTKYETELTIKLLKDILGRSYYHSENASPIQALEKAISDVREDILHLQEAEGEKDPNEETLAQNEKVELNIIASVLWAGVLYTVKHGSGEVSVIRGGDFKSIEMIKEGNYSVATGMIKKEDVVVLSTQKFAEKFPPKKLLRLTGEETKNLSPTESCIMIKFEPLENTNNEAQVEAHFGKGVKNPSLMQKGRATFKKMLKKRGALTIKEGITAIGIKKPRKINKKAFSKGITIMLGIALLVTIVYTQNLPSLNFRKNDTVKVISPEGTSKTEVSSENEESKEVVTEESLPTEVFYDLRIVNPQADPISLNIIEDKIYSLDKNGDLLVSDIKTPKFAKIPNTKFEKAVLVKNKGKELFINGETSIKDYNPQEAKTGETIVKETGVFFPYLNALYQIEGDAVKKYTIGDDTGEGAVWAESEDFVGAKDMAISVSIYVLTKSDGIVRYTSGVKDIFNIRGMETEFKNAVKLDTNWDWKNMYVADAGNNRIVVLTKEGNFVKEIKNETGEWENIRSIAISEDERKLFVLDGTRVFEVSL